jgi:hypothetical protein
MGLQPLQRRYPNYKIADVVELYDQYPTDLLLVEEWVASVVRLD